MNAFNRMNQSTSFLLCSKETIKFYPIVTLRFIFPDWWLTLPHPLSPTVFPPLETTTACWFRLYSEKGVAQVSANTFVIHNLILIGALRGRHCNPILWMRKLRFTKVKQHDHSILCINYSCRLTFLLPSLAWQLPKGRHSIFTSTSPRPGQAYRRRSMSTAGLSTVTTDKWQSCTRTRPDTMAHALSHSFLLFHPGF